MLAYTCETLTDYSSTAAADVQWHVLHLVLLESSLELVEGVWTGTG